MVLRPRMAARYLGLSVATLRRLRLRGGFPPAIKLTGQSIGWRVADLDQWLRERTTA